MMGKRAQIGIALVFLAYVSFLRTHGITDSFLMLGEQIRDWNVALGGWSDLPLSGAPSTVGGRGLGPAYYWALWVGRHLVGPFMENLPHAGGVAISLFQAIADTLLLVALMRRLPVALALAAALLIASQPFEVGLSAAIWNPPVATAFSKIALALMLGVRSSPGEWHWRIAAGVAWLGVQAHTSGVFVAAPIFAAILGEPALKKDWNEATSRLAWLAGLVFVLQLPFLVNMLQHPDEAAGPTAAVQNISNLAALDATSSFARVTSLSAWLIWHGPDDRPDRIPALVATAAVAWQFRKDLRVLAATVGPLLTATLLFATWTRPFETYWFLPLAPPVVLAGAFAIAAVPAIRVVQVVGIAFMALVLWRQPDRMADSQNFFRYPQYRPLLLGSRAARQQAPVLRHVRAGFDVHETTDVGYLYRILGGRIAPDADLDATIQPDGTVRLTPATQP